ncbi:MAG: hypothetical protein ACLQQ4_06105, partial [Bacteroidia bacterium]
YLPSENIEPGRYGYYKENCKSPISTSLHILIKHPANAGCFINFRSAVILINLFAIKNYFSGAEINHISYEQP